MQQNEQRSWLKPPEDIELHYNGFRKQGWNPSVAHNVHLHKAETIEYMLRRAKFLTTHGDIEAAKDTFRELALKAPNNREVLLECVAFELGCQDKIAAEGYLCCLIMLESDDQQHRERRMTLLPDVDLCDNFRLHDELETVFEQYIKIERPTSAELLESRKTAFFQRLIYNSLAIEGNQLSLHEMCQITRHADDRTFRARPDMDEAHLEVHGMLDIIAYIGKKKMSANDLRTLDLQELNQWHNILLRDKPTKAGIFRRENVWIHEVPFEPVEWKLVPEEMDKFIHFLHEGVDSVFRGRANEEEEGIGRNMHAVEFAVLAHYHFVHVHPYADGNGRMARLILNICLEAFGFPPINVPVWDRLCYMQALYRANMGDLRPFIRLIARYLYRTLAAAVTEKAPYAIAEADDVLPQAVCF